MDKSGHNLEQYTDRLVQLGMHVLCRGHEDPEKDGGVARHARTEFIGPGPVNRIAYDEIFESSAAEPDGNRGVHVQYVKRNEAPACEGVVPSNVARTRIHLLKFALRDEEENEFRVQLEKPADAELDAFAMKEMGTAMGKYGKTFRVPEELDLRNVSVFYDSEIGAAMEQTILKIITILEEAAIPPAYREEILKPLRALNGTD
jgi:hypothetical protein